MNPLYIIGFFLIILSLYHAVKNLRYLYTGKGKPDNYTVMLLMMGNYGLVFNMLWNHSCEASVIDFDPETLAPKIITAPVVDMTLAYISVIIFALNLLAVLSAWARDELYIVLKKMVRRG